MSSSAVVGDVETSKSSAFPVPRRRILLARLQAYISVFGEAAFFRWLPIRAQRNLAPLFTRDSIFVVDMNGPIEYRNRSAEWRGGGPLSKQEAATFATY